jgi:serine/threonine protein kinase
MIQILQTTQIFKLTTGSPEFAYTSVLFAKDDATFKAKFFGRGMVNPNKLLDVQHIPPESSYPTIRPGCSIATSSGKWYVKTPNLMSFDGGNSLAELILRELTTCEIIQRFPHRNLAEFQGCRVANDRIIGLCFNRYIGSLQDTLNPGSLNKSAFILSKDRAQLRKRASRHLPQIEEGIQYLHSLELIHNDINPANIMLSEDEIPIIIDFDTSCAPGKELGMAKRTYGWYDPQVNISQVCNDLDALAELRVWLTGTSPDEFQFGQY